MKQKIPVYVCLLFFLFNCDEQNTQTSEDWDISKSKLKVIPIGHATMIIEYKDLVIYVDPIGGKEAFKGHKPPSIVLLTDVHSDHLSIETILKFNNKHMKIVAPIAVSNRLPANLKPNLSIISNFQSMALGKGRSKLEIEAIPMYNLREEALKFHEKGRGNGYVLSLGGERIYISGDTEAIPEMRALKHIDRAFVCMNLPWTMSVESAAEAVLEFEPKHIFPYHYKGTNGLSDINKFKQIIEDNSDRIDVHLLNWYPNR